MRRHRDGVDGRCFSASVPTSDTPCSKNIGKLLTEVISMQDDDFKYIPTEKKSNKSHYRKQANETRGMRKWDG